MTPYNLEQLIYAYTKAVNYANEQHCLFTTLQYLKEHELQFGVCHYIEEKLDNFLDTDIPTYTEFHSKMDRYCNRTSSELTLHFWLAPSPTVCDTIEEVREVLKTRLDFLTEYENI